jgi:hypothetical protein
MIKKVNQVIDNLALLIFLTVAVTGLTVVVTQDKLFWVDFIFDDSYYYLGIARNIVENHSSSFLPPFETNGYQPLWLIILSASGFIWGTGETSLVIQALLLTYVFCLLFFILSKSNYGVGWPAILIVFAYPSVMLLGLETVILPALVLIFFNVKNWKARGLIAGLIFLTRLDALAILVGSDLYRFFIKREISIKYWIIVLPVIVSYLLINYLIFNTPLPVSGLAKSIGNIQGENILPAILFERSAVNQIIGAALLYFLYKFAIQKSQFRYSEQIVSTLIAIFICASYYTVMSGWPLWDWYYWPIMLLHFFCIQELLKILEGNHKFQHKFVAITLISLLFAKLIIRVIHPAQDVPRNYASVVKQVYLGTPNNESFGENNIKLINYLKNEGLKKGAIFLMGDRAGSFGYFLGNDYGFIHTEGLVGSYEYIKALKRDQGLDFIEKYKPDFLVVDRERYFETSDVIGVAEPIQGLSSHFGPYLMCFNKAYIINETINATRTRRRLLIDFSGKIDCPKNMLDQFYKVRNEYGGLRSFSLPSEHLSESYKFIKNLYK